MLILAALFTLAYAFVNAFGTWMVVRRKPWVAFLFMLAAALLMIAFAAFIGSFPYTRVILGSGLILASVTSLINAYVVLGKVVWKHHVTRALCGVVIFLLAHFRL
ncbi:MAG: hypothetical protein ACRCYY_02410 [Trueperaceae bacterium]